MPMRDSMEETDHTANLLPLELNRLAFETTGGTRIIDGVDLTLNGGKLTVIMGPNGAGKSVLLRLLHGLIEPTDGDVRWGGQPISADVRRRQALVFQRPVLLRRSVGANIDFVLRLRGDLDTSERDAILDGVGLLDRAQQPARLLSGGEQQRLALARALATKPDVLLLDEPTASLDPGSTAMIEQITQDVQRTGCKVIFVTHDIGQARRLADDVIFLHQGRVVEQSAAEEFFERPQSQAARTYLEGRLDF